MKELNGKYRIRKDNNTLRISYVFTISDIFGGLLYLIGLLLGILLLYVDSFNYTIEKLYTFRFWLLLLVGGFLTIYFLYILTLSFYNPLKGIIEVDKSNQEIIIRNFFKKEKVKFSSIGTMFCEITETKNPRQKYGMLIIKKLNGEKVECFIIRSSIPIDLGRKIDKNIIDTTNQIKKSIAEFIELKK